MSRAVATMIWPRRCVAALLLCLGLCAAVAPAAAQAQAPAVEQVAAGRPSLLTRAGQAFVKLQRDVNRAITRQLVAIRRGEAMKALMSTISALLGLGGLMISAY